MDNFKVIAAAVVALIAILAGFLMLNHGAPAADPLMHGQIAQDSMKSSTNYILNHTHADTGVVDSWHMAGLNGSWHLRYDPDSEVLQLWAVWWEETGVLHEDVVMA